MMSYDPEALKAELPRLEEQAALFETKAAELRASAAQYRVWIKELEARHAKA